MGTRGDTTTLTREMGSAMAASSGEGRSDSMAPSILDNRITLTSSFMLKVCCGCDENGKYCA